MRRRRNVAHSVSSVLLKGRPRSPSMALRLGGVKPGSCAAGRRCGPFRRCGLFGPFRRVGASDVASEKYFNGEF